MMNEKRKEVEVLRPEVQGSDNRGGNLFEGYDLPHRLFRLRTSPPAQPQRKNVSEKDLGRLLGMMKGLLSTYLRVLVLSAKYHCRVKVRALPPPLPQSILEIKLELRVAG